MSEETYQSIVRGRMLEDDFIEDDDGSGYVDHGQDEWARADESASDTEDENDYFARTGRKKPKKKSVRRATRSEQSDYARSHARRSLARAPRDVPAAPAPTKDSEDAFMSQLFGGLQSGSTPARAPSALLWDDPAQSPSVVMARKRKAPVPPPTTLPALVPDNGSSEPSSDAPDMSYTAKKPRSSSTDVAPMDESDDDDFQRVQVAALRETHVVTAPATRTDVQATPKPAPVPADAPTPPTATATPMATPAAPSSDASEPTSSSPTQLQSWRSVHRGLATSQTPATASARATSAAHDIQCFADDRSVPFFWLDYVDAHGQLMLFGKVLDRATNKYVSASLAIDGMERCVFLQPRPRTLSHGHETDMVPGEDELFEEFEAMRSRFGIKSWLGKWVTRKYAFELPDVPAEGPYLKIKYGFDEPALPADVSGATFLRAHGTHTSAFELFVVKRRIMGPCWLRVEHAAVHREAPHTWCKLELRVDEPKSVTPYADSDESAPKDAPPLTVMSLALRSVVNFKENKREIVAASARVWRDLAIENATPVEQVPSSSFVAVRSLGASFPPRFEATAAQSGVKSFKYERLLLQSLLAQIQFYDADVIVSHDFVGSTLDILLHRLRELKCEQWTRIGRLRQDATKLATTAPLPTRALVGRLVADLSSDTAKGMIASTTWSLSEMCRTHLNMQREDIDPDDVASYFDCTAPTPDRLLTFVRHCEVDAYFHMALANKVQLLALTKQLTNLAGNAWGRTLNGGRAERNEYILLHEFHKKKYLCPDKVSSWERRGAAGAKASRQRKDKFKGGLVLDPKRGLWDRYILVMDFNSLYPSIIQEFNIDFTTVERARAPSGDADALADDDVPALPSSDVAQGVLPHLISTLVARRRQVKALLKDKNAPPLKRLQWDIKQQALKLTANSMYGCLGYEHSRFYARPLAALTTFKGREILSMTRELAESMSLDVIYGDTDSVMINTRCIDYPSAWQIGQAFKKAVNERYRLLEIDIDSVFQRMLLLQKKKYAARLVLEDGQTRTEIKGLDMKRREYCALSKRVSAYVLDQILAGEATDTVVEAIHEHLQQVAADVRAGRVPLDEFVIHKRLGKRPQDYPDAASQPHVQVALRMQAKSESVRSGDVIPYVFCVGPPDTKASQAERAFHPDDVRRHHGDAAYAIDYRHYLAHQILPPIERLADCIEGTDRARLAECLGLEGHAYATPASAADASRALQPLDSQVPSRVRYAACAPWQATCRHCRATTVLRPLAQLPADAPWRACAQCHQPLPLPSLVVQLQTRIREHIAEYYAGVSTCSEPSCRATTNVTGVYNGRCVVPQCKGKVQLKYTDQALYTQLCYYAYVVDAAQALDEVRDAAQRDHIRRLAEQDSEALTTLKDTVQAYLARNGRRFVSLGRLFSFMRAS